MEQTRKLAEQFSSRLMDKRKERGLTQEDLARLAGIMRQQVGKLETGEHMPRIDTVKKLAKALKCKAGFLAFGDEK